MRKEWRLEVVPADADAYEFHLKVGGMTGEEEWELIHATGSLRDFEREMDSLREEAARLKEEARQKLEGLMSGEGALEPADVWLRMEGLDSRQEMFDYFNEFSRKDRERIAEYVLTQVNMFKGLGPVFAERYNTSSSLLE